MAEVLGKRDQLDSKEMLAHLIAIGRVYSSGKSFTDLFKELMEKVRRATGAEGGSLYIYDRANEMLKIVVLTNDVLGVNKVVEKFDALRISGFIEVPMRNKAGEVNLNTVSVCCFHDKRKIFVSDLQKATEFDFTNTLNFDRQNNYHTRNLMVFPLFGHGEDVIGVLQIVNSDNSCFNDDMQPFLNALISQVSIVLNNALLVNEAQNLLSALVQMVGMAIDEKSPHTAGHCQRVTWLTLKIIDMLEQEKEGAYAGFSMNENERREIHIAALLHDIGKVVTPTHIMEKSTKLYTLYDRVNLLRERLSAWCLSEKIRRLEEALRRIGREDILEQLPDIELNDDFEFLSAINRAEVVIDDKVERRLQEISARTISHLDVTNLCDGEEQLIKKNEFDNLRVMRGTLNPEERKIMEEHVNISIRLLSSIPWPRNLERVVEYAGAHHENMNGKGYPHGLTGDDLAVPARVLAMADRFEGITAPDRPYRSTQMKLSQAMKIMTNMADEREIDSELFALFRDRKVYMTYAQAFLPPELIDCT